MLFIKTKQETFDGVQLLAVSAPDLHSVICGLCDVDRTGLPIEDHFYTWWGNVIINHNMEYHVDFILDSDACRPMLSMSAAREIAFEASPHAANYIRTYLSGKEREWLYKHKHTCAGE